VGSRGRSEPGPASFRPRTRPPHSLRILPFIPMGSYLITQDVNLPAFRQLFPEVFHPSAAGAKSPFTEMRGPGKMRLVVWVGGGGFATGPIWGKK
jgi:hypothetical protein